MSEPQNTLAVIFASLWSTCPSIGQALALAGWSARVVAGEGADCAAAGMIVLDAGGSISASHGHAIIAAVMTDGQTPRFSADLIIDPRQDPARIATQLRQWAIPSADALVRMEKMFGRDGLLPVVQGLRTELERALDNAIEPDAHRLAGLTGTLGFAAASAGWRAVDAGAGDKVEALRHSRTTLVAVDGWMRRPA